MAGKGAAKPKEAIGETESEDHIAEFDKQLERLESIALDANFESGSLVGDIRDVLLNTFKNRPKPWSQLSEGEQRDLAIALENVAKTVIKKVVFVVAEQDEISVVATLKGYSAKGGTFKLNAEARGDKETAEQLFDMDGHDVVIMSADAQRFTGKTAPAAVQPDQAALEFADKEEVDLEAAAEPDTAELEEGNDDVEEKPDVEEPPEEPPEGEDAESEGATGPTPADA